MPSRFPIAFAVAVSILALAACNAGPDPAASPEVGSGANASDDRTSSSTDVVGQARAALRDSEGKTVGTVHVTGVPEGLELTLDVTGMTPGQHGVHVHETGRCDAPDFASAGGHWNPGARQHGLDNPSGSHKGDMPNLTVGADGSGTLRAIIGSAESLRAGNGRLLDEDGAAFIIHAKADDQRTDPSGASGDRIACGVFKPVAG